MESCSATYFSETETRFQYWYQYYKYMNGNFFIQNLKILTIQGSDKTNFFVAQKMFCFLKCMNISSHFKIQTAFGI